MQLWSTEPVFSAFNIRKVNIHKLTLMKSFHFFKSNYLRWSALGSHIDVIMKVVYQQLYLFRSLKRFGTSPNILQKVSSPIASSPGAAFPTDRNTCGFRQWWIQRSASWAEFSIKSISMRHSLKKLAYVTKDTYITIQTMPFFLLLASKRRYRSLKSHITWFRNSSFPTTIRFLTNLYNPNPTLATEH